MPESITINKNLGIIEGHDKLMSTIVDLLKHIWNEDERRYPILKIASEHNKKLKEILSFTYYTKSV